MKALGLIEVNGYLAGIEAADAALKAANVTLIALEKVNAGITNVQITGDIGAVKAAVDAGKIAAESLGMLRAYHVIPRLHEETLKLFPNINKEVKKDIDIPVNNRDFKVDEKLKREFIGSSRENKHSIAEENKEIEDNIEEIKNDMKQEVKDEVKKEIKADITEKVEEIKTDISEEIKDIKEEKKSEFKDNITQEVKEYKNQKIEEDKKQKKGESVVELNKELNKEENLIDYSLMRVDELRKLVSNLNLPHLTNKQIKFEKKDELIKILLEYGSEGGK